MAILEIDTLIDAPAAVCFDLIRDPRIQSAITETEGARGVGQLVTFAVTGGVRLIIKVTDHQRPHKLVDTMIKGPFRIFVHTHEFRDEGGRTRVVDKVEWISAFGSAGRIFDTFIVQPRLRRLIRSRNMRLRQIAETDGD